MRDRKLDLAAARLSCDDYPVTVNQAGRHLTERNGCFSSSKCELAEGLGRGDYKGISADDQPLWPPQRNPIAADAPKSARSKNAGTIKDGFKAHLRLYLAAQGSIPGALTVSPLEHIHPDAGYQQRYHKRREPVHAQSLVSGRTHDSGH